jgi:hypothetical protein
LPPNQIKSPNNISKHLGRRSAETSGQETIMAKMFELRNQLLDSFSEEELYDLKSAGDDLWQTVSRENIFKFSQLWEAAEQHVEKNTIFLEEEDYKRHYRE